MSRKCSTLHLPLYKELMKSQIQAEGGRGVGIAEMNINMVGRISTLVISELTTMTLAGADIAGVSPMPSNLGELAFGGLAHLA